MIPQSVHTRITARIWTLWVVDLFVRTDFPIPSNQTFSWPILSCGQESRRKEILCRIHRERLPDRRFYRGKGFGQRDAPSVTRDQNVTLSRSLDRQGASPFAQNLSGDLPALYPRTNEERAGRPQAVEGGIAAPIPYREQR